MNGQVRIGREFFQKVKMDYADWRWALVREFLQNCFDAPGSRNVTVEIIRSGGTTGLEVTNDGAPMDRETLVNKLLTLGGSGKNFDGENTGGFGVAKSLLYYCHQSYRIQTGALVVSGEGGEYSISDATEPLTGTRSTIVIDGDCGDDLEAAVETFAARAQWKGKLVMNGRELATDLKKGARRKDLGWAVVYTNHSFQNECVVRLNGQPMFSRYTRFKGTVLVELAGKAKDCLTSNRDGLNSKLANELSDLLTALAVDKKSALREQRAEYKRYQGELQRAEAAKPKEGDLSSVVDQETMAALMRVAAGSIGTAQVAPPTSGGIQLVVASKSDEPDKTISVGPQFILKSTKGKVPAWWTPGERFCKMGKDLVRVWTGCLLKLHAIAGRGGEFSVGFVIDDESKAEYETGVYGPVYYINPDMVKQTHYRTAWNSRFDIIASAAHEFVHGAYGLKQHDEDYAGALTEVMGLCMANMGALVDMFRPIVKLPASSDEGVEVAPLRFGRS